MELTEIYRHCTEEEKECLDFLYQYMPISDQADYPPELFLQFVKHACMVRHTVPWGEKFNQEIFLNYVLQCRINNENLEFYCKEFFDEIYPRIQGMCMYDAAVEVNYWCFEKATYQSTDIRTMSPYGVINNAYGRCGEESVLAVAAFRSVGIPARQCYTPRWAHCDDNHAWVEVWIDGDWHFLGACEPDARLDTGWFRLPASKGMLIHNRVQSGQISGELITRQTNRMTEINVLPRYAKTRKISVQVLDQDQCPAAGAMVRFEVVNFSEFYPLTTLKTDTQGQVRFVTGLGDLMIHASKGESYAFEKMDVRKTGHMIITLSDNRIEPAVTQYLFVPPTGGIEDETPVSKETEELHKKRSEQAAGIRKAFEQTFFQEEEALSYALAYSPYEKEAAKLLVESRGNHEELLKFLNDQETKDDLKYKIRLLQALKKKDLTDCKAEILKEHLQMALPYKDQQEELVFSEALLCPRIWIEHLAPYRKAILKYFGRERLQQFKNDPLLLDSWIADHIETFEDQLYANLTTSPPGLLEVRKGNSISKKILFIATLRTAGVPAKLDQADLSCMYYHGGRWNWISVQNKDIEKNAVLVLKKPKKEQLEYYKNYTVSCLKNGVYQTLDYTDSVWSQDEIRLPVFAGGCRVVVSERQPDESNLVRVYYVKLKKNETAAVEVSLPKQAVTGAKVAIENYCYHTLEGEARNLHNDLMEGSGMVLWLAAGEEPTEHLLNEIIEAKEKFIQKQPNIIVVLEKYEDIADPTLQKAVRNIPFIKIRIGYKFADLTELCDSFNIKDKRLPLAAVTAKTTARFAWSGYNVGIGELLLKHVE